MLSKNRLHYVLDTFRLVYGVDDLPEIAYTSSTSTSPITIRPASGSFFDSKQSYDVTNVTWLDWRGRRLPFLFCRPGVETVLRHDGSAVVVEPDILASAFFFLSGWQEWSRPARDAQGRFPYRESLQFELDMPEVAVVDEYFSILAAAMAEVRGEDLSVRRFGEHPFTVFASHDIDVLHSGYLEEGLAALKKGRLTAAAAIAMRRMTGSDTWFNIDDVVQTEETAELRSTFFFLPRQGAVNGVKNADYDISSHRLRQAIGLLLEHDFEVGLHGSLGSHADADHLVEDALNLAADISGNRFHFLAFDASTPAVLEKAGIDYDSTLGFAERPGFRNGTCRPFYLYDLASDRATDVLEIPLVVMDSMMGRHYMRLEPAERKACVARLIDEVERQAGILCVNWHNSRWSDHKYEGWLETFEYLIAECRRRKAGFVTGRKILELYRGSNANTGS